MTHIEAMKLALEALKNCHYYMLNAGLPNQSLLNEVFKASNALRQAIEQAEQAVNDGPINEDWQLSVSHGHSGYGVYAHMIEYPEESEVFLFSVGEPDISPPSQPDQSCAETGVCVKSGRYCPPRQTEQAEQKENLVGLPPEAKGCVTILIQGTSDDGQQISSVMRLTKPYDILSLPHLAEQLARVFHNQFTA